MMALIYRFEISGGGRKVARLKKYEKVLENAANYLKRDDGLKEVVDIIFQVESLYDYKDDLGDLRNCIRICHGFMTQDTALSIYISQSD